MEIETMTMGLYEKLFRQDLFTPVENSHVAPPAFVLLVALTYITLVLIIYRFRKRLGSEYLPLQLLIFILAAFTMGELHNPMLEDQYSYLTASERLFWERPLYVWLTYYLGYYGTLLLNIMLFTDLVHVTRRLCADQNIDEDLPILFLLANPFSLFLAYWVLPEVVIAFTIIVLYYTYTQRLTRIAFLLNLPLIMIKPSAAILALPMDFLFLRKRNPSPST